MFYELSALKGSKDISMNNYRGKVLKRYSPFISPLKIEEDILKAVNNINI